METFSIERDLTLIMKNTKQDFCRIWGRNALGKLSGVTVSTSGYSDSDTYGGEVLGDHRASLTLPTDGEDVELVTVPDVETFFPLPSTGENPEPPPLGAMFCDVYEEVGGRMKKVQEASSIDDPGELQGGVTGPGLEFFYAPGTKDYRETDLDLSVPAFRDTMTPSLPRETLEGLFNYGSGSGSRTSTNSRSQPTLRSAI